MTLGLRSRPDRGSHERPGNAGGDTATTDWGLSSTIRKTHSYTTCGDVTRFSYAGEIAAWIASQYRVRFRGNSMYSVPERLGCSPMGPGSRHEKEVGRSWTRGYRSEY